MKWRVFWGIASLFMVFIAPWWVVLCMGIIGAIIFPWYIEIIFLGACFDALFGGATGAWYRTLIHTGIFTIPLLVILPLKGMVRTRS